MAPEKKAKPRLNLFLYKLPNPACQNPNPEGHLRIQKAQQIDEWDQKRIEKTKNIILRIETFRGITFQIEKMQVTCTKHNQSLTADKVTTLVWRILWLRHKTRAETTWINIFITLLSQTSKEPSEYCKIIKEITQNIKVSRSAALKTLEGTPTQANE